MIGNFFEFDFPDVLRIVGLDQLPILRNRAIQLILIVVLFKFLISRALRFFARQNSKRKMDEAMQDLIEYQSKMEEYILMKDLRQEKIMQQRINEAKARCAYYSHQVDDVDIVGLGGVYGYWTQKLFEERKDYITSLIQVIKEGYSGWVAKFLASKPSAKGLAENQADKFYNQKRGNRRGR